MNHKILQKITSEDVREIHAVITAWFAGSEDPVSPSGVKDKGLLDSAVARPFQTAEENLLIAPSISKVPPCFML